jgi:hypothetical protein
VCSSDLTPRTIHGMSDSSIVFLTIPKGREENRCCVYGGGMKKLRKFSDAPADRSPLISIINIRRSQEIIDIIPNSFIN